MVFLMVATAPTAFLADGNSLVYSSRHSLVADNSGLGHEIAGADVPKSRAVAVRPRSDGRGTAITGAGPWKRGCRMTPVGQRP